jgi:hypothetical protein
MVIVGQRVQQIVDYCHQRLNLAEPIDLPEYGYDGLPLCVIDAVFSINVRYQVVQKIIERFQAHYPQKTLSLEDLFQAYRMHDVEGMAANIYRSHHRTSPRGGILKAEAVLRFAEALVACGADTKENALMLIGNLDFETRIFQIPGQNSGVSLSYFYMLAGATDMVKPDRMIVRFVQEATGQSYDPKVCQKLVIQASFVLRERYPHISARMLDNMIWTYMNKRSLTT